MSLPTIVSGIRATGKLHVGNYLGALQPFVELQNSDKYDCYFFIADLHAITTPFSPSELTKNTLEVVAEYIAAGLNPDKVTLFLQHHVPQHAELAWIFNCITPLGELERMTQFKDKSKQNSGSINAGLLTYPALMAADILLYKPIAVPVGEDQIQHIELTRMVARKFNKQFGNTFPEIKTLVNKPLRIKSLTNPESKMSKTGDEALMIEDGLEQITRKLKKAVTATEANGLAPGVENLFLLLKHFGTETDYKRLEKELKDGSIKYSELKTVLGESISSHFSEFREKKKELMANPKKLQKILAQGAEKARIMGQKTLSEVHQKIGLAH
mgnify:CR=1 FL=1